jgi:hypothetical protein
VTGGRFSLGIIRHKKILHEVTPVPAVPAQARKTRKKALRQSLQGMLSKKFVFLRVLRGGFIITNKVF